MRLGKYQNENSKVGWFIILSVIVTCQSSNYAKSSQNPYPYMPSASTKNVIILAVIEVGSEGGFVL